MARVRAFGGIKSHDQMNLKKGLQRQTTSLKVINENALKSYDVYNDVAVKSKQVQNHAKSI